MIHHTVLFRWKSTTTLATQRDLEAKLLALKGAIPEIRAIAAGLNRDAESVKEWPFVLEVRVDDLAALQRYTDHPAHQAVVAELRQAREARLAVDLQVG